jgi:hypothetical protein
MTLSSAFSRPRIVSLLALLFILSLTITAQDYRAKLQGAVTDQASAAVPNSRARAMLTDASFLISLNQVLTLLPFLRTASRNLSSAASSCKIAVI